MNSHPLLIRRRRGIVFNLAQLSLNFILSPRRANYLIRLLIQGILSEFRPKGYYSGPDLFNYYCISLFAKIYIPNGSLEKKIHYTNYRH